MFKTKNLVSDIKQVPTGWIFEHFCKLKHKLTGEDIKIKSLFTEEKTPSMCIYLDTKSKTYKFKDFSSGLGGDGVNLVKELCKTTYYKACMTIIETYNDYILSVDGSCNIVEFKEQLKYKVISVSFRSWTTQDQYFWTQFNIGSKLLDEYHVRPLDYYYLAKGTEELCIKGNYIYGYFNEAGELYKIYQPKTLDKKFIKVASYIQGIEQIKFNDYLLITSSLKDIMSLKSLKLKMDIIAPDSENTMINKEMMKKFIKSYKKVVILFDNDEPGIKAMIKYKEVYPEVGICILPMSKDPSDSIKDYTAKEVRNRLVPIIHKKINEKENSYQEASCS